MRWTGTTFTRATEAQEAGSIDVIGRRFTVLRRPGEGVWPSPRPLRDIIIKYIHMLTVCLVGGLAACAGSPPGAPLDLSVGPNAPTWPRPPDAPRYALVGELIGEQNFVDRGKLRSGAGRLFRIVVGLAIGKRRLRELRRPVTGFTAEDGAVYVTDMSLRAVVKFDLRENRLLIWRDAARKETFVAPAAVIGDGVGGVLVSDAEKAEVFRLDATGAPTGRFGGDVLLRPLGLARDAAADVIYVADAGDHTIKKFSGDGAFLGAFGGPGLRAGDFNTPTHLWFDDERLYVSDTFNFRVQEFDRAGRAIIAFGENGVVIGDMARPKGVAVGEGGRIYVVESLFDRLLVFDRQARLLMTLAGDGGAAAPAFFLPAGVWTDAAGRVYVADMFNGRILVYQELTALEGAS